MVTTNQNSGDGLGLVIKAVEESGLADELPSLITIPRTRGELYGKVFAYYTHLQSKFPDKINWDGCNEFEYREWDTGSFVINYRARPGEFGYTHEMFEPSDRQMLEQMLRDTSPSNPEDIILPIPDLGIIVPFLDVKKLHQIWFKSNEEL